MAPIVRLVAIVIAAIVSVGSADQYYVGNGGAKNVYGDDLARCSKPGEALTGYTRTGYCVTDGDDMGSHHICIDVGGTSGGNFCTVTGQPNWCSQKMTCDTPVDTDTMTCPVEHWCVCQWAFASYIQNAGGCEKIQTIACESINQQALKAYQRQARISAVYQQALDCINQRCGLENSITE